MNRATLVILVGFFFTGQTWAGTSTPSIPPEPAQAATNHPDLEAQRSVHLSTTMTVEHIVKEATR